MPIWGGGALFYAMLLLAMEVGYRTGCRQHAHGEAAKGSGRNLALSFVGHNAGVAGQISRWRLAILALVFTGVVLVIMDFDRPESGYILVSQDGIRTLLEEMRADLGQY